MEVGPCGSLFVILSQRKTNSGLGGGGGGVQESYNSKERVGGGGTIYVCISGLLGGDFLFYPFSLDEILHLQGD